jgi:hypothetical protein
VEYELPPRGEALGRRPLMLSFDVDCGEPPNARVLTFSLAGVAPRGFDDSANPVGNLVVDLVRGDAVWRADRNLVGAHACVVGKLALISNCYGEYWAIDRR